MTASKRLLILFTALAIVIGASLCVNAQTVTREYVIRKAGAEIGTTSIEISQGADQTNLSTVVVYPQMGLEIHSEYLFAGIDFPKKPVSYNFSVKAGGVLDLELQWADSTAYTIKQLGQTVELPNSNVLALDNNVISDYMVATWIFDKSSMDVLESSLVVPVQLPYGTQLAPMIISYVGEELIGQHATDHFQINIGVVVDVWVEQIDRSLVKLHIPMQAFEIEAVDLALDPEAERVFDDFGGFNFQELEFSLNVERAKLSGTMTIPEVDGELPGVVLVAGSGPTDRDGNSYVMPGPADYLKEISHYLASRGVVVARFDKRGVGESTGEVHSFSDYINDVDAVVNLLATLTKVDAESLFIVGHSEGAWLASEVARKREDLAGLVLLAGSGYPFFDTIKRQITSQSEAAAAAGIYDPELPERAVKALDDMYQAVLNNTEYDVSQYDLPAEFEQLILTFVYQRDVLKDWLTADPAGVLAEVKVPVLIMQGTADIQIQPDDAYALAAALPDEQSELHIFEGLDHILKMTYGEPLSYTDPNRRVDRELLNILGDWILKHSQVTFNQYHLPF